MLSNRLLDTTSILSKRFSKYNQPPQTFSWLTNTQSLLLDIMMYIYLMSNNYDIQKRDAICGTNQRFEKNRSDQEHPQVRREFQRPTPLPVGHQLCAENLRPTPSASAASFWYQRKRERKLCLRRSKDREEAQGNDHAQTKRNNTPLQGSISSAYQESWCICFF